MEIPRHWAEGRISMTRADGRVLTLRRFGWSSESPAAAQRHADERIQQAATQAQTERKPTRCERKVAYAGAEGLPIREEIVSEHPEIGGIVTRNGYGARCLNIPNILFADVDLGEPHERWRAVRRYLGIMVVFAVMVLVLGLMGRHIPVLALVVLFTAVCLPVTWLLVRAWRAWRVAAQPSLALAPVQRWCAAHRDWRIHAYRTPAGLRLLATHAPIDPRGEEATSFFQAVRADPVYRRMCQRQDCFRARLSPKPWRIGMSARIGWGVWPVTTDQASTRRTAWIEVYEQRATNFAACSWLGEFGQGDECPQGRAVRELHDRLSQVGRDLPIA